MTPLLPYCPRLAMSVLLACAMSCGAYAQQTPITGQMGSPAASPVSADIAVVSPVAAPVQPVPAAAADMNTDVGSVTRQLLGMQRQGTNAGKALPIPGQEASASYQRYLKSFEHPIPEFYEAAVSKNAGSTSGASGSP